MEMLAHAVAVLLYVVAGCIVVMVLVTVAGSVYMLVCAKEQAKLEVETERQKVRKGTKEVRDWAARYQGERLERDRRIRDRVKRYLQ